MPLNPVATGYGDIMDLYHARVLELAANITKAKPLAHPQASATRVSRVCGSAIRVDLNLDGEVITEIGMVVQACALGQAAAAVLAAHAIGASAAEVRAARDGLEAMLREGSSPPSGRFWELRHLEGVKDYPPRFASTLLAFDAAVEALDSALRPDMQRS